MTENTPSTTENAAAARAAEQARLRKERREAKIKAGGTARLNRITGLGGGLQRDPAEAKPAAPAASAPETPAASSGANQEDHADPEEVDISQHFYTPRTNPRLPPSGTPPNDISDAHLRELMLGFDRAGPGGSMPFPPGLGGPNMEDDPMMKLLSQMMGGGGGGANIPGFGPGLGDGGSTAPFPMGPPQTAAVVPDRYASLWRLVHFAVALGLGLYIALFTPFTGSRAERERSAFEHSVGHVTEQDIFKQYFFYAFATAETVLLTSRFFLDRGRATPTGIIWTVAGFLPEPLKGYLKIALRYGQILSTVRSDILVCVFVLGVCSWIRAS